MVRALLAAGFEPIPAARVGSDRWRLEGLDLAWGELDLSAGEAMAGVLAQLRPDAIVHCAAYGVDYRQQDLMEAIAVNVTGTARLVEAAAQAGVARFLHVGTCFEYAEKSSPLQEHDPLSPATLYGATKAAGSLLALERAKSLGLSLCVIRPFGMFGPLEGPHKLVPLIQQASETSRALPLTEGEQIRDYTYVGDIADCLVEMLRRADFPRGEVFNLGSGTPIALKDFVLRCARVFDGEAWMRLGALEYRPNEVRMLVADSAKWEGYYGRPVVRTRLEEGLAAMQKGLR